MSVQEKLSSLKDRINGLLDRSNSICLWFSGGADSTLLLQVMSETGKPFDVLRFEDGLSREQRKRIDAIILNLKNKPMVFSYPPRQMLLIGDSKNISTVTWYPVSGGVSMPVLRDLVKGEQCYFDVVKEQVPVNAAPVEYVHHIVGIRSDEEHWAVGNLLLAGPEWQLGARHFYAPLADWTKQEVADALQILGVEFDQPPDELDSGNISCCFACMKNDRPAFCPKENKFIDSVAWDRRGNLGIFHKTLGLEE